MDGRLWCDGLLHLLGSEVKHYRMIAAQLSGGYVGYLEEQADEAYQMSPASGHTETPYVAKALINYAQTGDGPHKKLWSGVSDRGGIHKALVRVDIKILVEALEHLAVDCGETDYVIVGLYVYHPKHGWLVNDEPPFTHLDKFRKNVNPYV